MQGEQFNLLTAGVAKKILEQARKADGPCGLLKDIIKIYYESTVTDSAVEQIGKSKSRHTGLGNFVWWFFKSVGKERLLNTWCWAAVGREGSFPFIKNKLQIHQRIKY